MRLTQILTLSVVLFACGVETAPNPDFDAGGDAQAGSGGTGGTSGSGGTGGTSGTGGSGGGDVDAGEDSGVDADASACPLTCDGSTPHCDALSMTCVACLETADCANAVGKVCSDGACVECAGSDGCTSPEVCKTDAHECVECLADTDCNSVDAAKCNLTTHTCVPCDDNTQCEGVSVGNTEVGVCDGGECVECSASDYAACGTAPNEIANVCDVSERTCTSLDVESAGLCQACVSSAQCDPGQVCAAQVFEGNTVGNFCFWLIASAQGPNGSCSSVPPYARGLTNQPTIEEGTANICALAVTTCPGINAFRNPSVQCAPNSTPDHDLCGFSYPNEGADSSNLRDAYCEQVPNDTVYRCTVPCQSDDDCKSGSSCLVGSPDKCGL